MENMPVKPSRGGDWNSWGDSADVNLRELALDHPGLKAQANTSTSDIANHLIRIAAVESGKADKTSLAPVATSGAYADLTGKPATSSSVVATKNTTRPTADTGVKVVFYTTAPPVAAMLAGDVWEPTA